ncbi:transmembrane protein 42-like isoform X2 [Liolophura sinensis]|uniref:transmembrane protein 42-like isoform X2 n=1 Tax=Liolophura sinensis TaxID=3198878 RepID=UPI0031589D0C
MAGKLAAKRNDLTGLSEEGVVKQPVGEHSSDLSSCSLGFGYASVAGLMGALASVGAKLALSAEEAVQDVCDSMVHSSYILLDVQCETVTGSIRVLSGAVLLVANILMWVFFTKSLRICSSSVEATITNTAVNFFASGLCGFLLFHERLPPLWWCGASLIVLGLLFLNKGSRTHHREKTD